MKASELRIGNRIVFRNNETEITPDAICMLYAMFKNNDVSDIYKPIPITEERLLRLGFRTFDGTIYGLVIGNYHIQIYFYDCWNLTIESDNEKCELQNYWAVHNLQNIIFEITGEELEWAR